jgi:hypothetical protein
MHMYSMNGMGDNGPVGPTSADLARSRAAIEAANRSNRLRVIYSMVTGMAGGMAAVYLHARRADEADLSKKVVVGAATGMAAAGLLNLGFYTFGRHVLPRT